MPISIRAWRLVAPLLLVLLVDATYAQSPADPFNYIRSSSFTYKSNGLLESEIVEPDAANVALCQSTTYIYDAYGNRTSATTANCTTGPVPLRQQFEPRTSTNDYNPVTMPTVSVAGITLSIPRGAFVINSSNAEGETEQKEYDPRFGAVMRLIGPNQLPTTWSLDEFGRKVRELRADGTSTVMAYCYLEGRVSDRSSNSANCPAPASAEVPADAVSFVHSELRSTADAKIGPYTRTYSDRLGRAIRTATEGFDGAGQPTALLGVPVITDTIYNSYGAKSIQSEPYYLTTGSSTATTAVGSNDQGATRTDYDVLGRPTVIYTADASGSQANIEFGPFGIRSAARTTFNYEGLTATAYNDKGQSRREEKNVDGKLVRITDNAGARLIHQHDAFGNLIQTVDALGNRLSMKVDFRGAKIELSDPDAGLTQYEYNALGELVGQQTAKQRAANTQTTLRYDRVGRLIERVEPEYVTTWTYGRYASSTSPCRKGVGKLCEVNTTNNGVNRRTFYDDLGRPINSRTTITNGPSLATALSYDATTSRVATHTYPTGLQVSYSYTARGFLEKTLLTTAATVTPLPAAAGGTPGQATSLSPDPLWQAQVVNAWGKVEKQIYGNRVTTLTAFEPVSGRASSIAAGSGAATSVLNHGYVWDSLDNLLQRNDGNGDAIAGAVSETFRYEDGMNRLTGYTVSAPAISGLSRSVTLQYNVLGQLLYKSDVGVYGYGPSGPGAVRPHALQSVTDSGGNATTYGYDANGNVISSSAGKYRSITYTSFNLPDSDGGISGAGNSPRYTWQYDENHARVKEVHVDGSGTRTTWYLHPDNSGGLGFESEISGSGAISQRHYISAGGQTIGVLVSTAALPQLGNTDTAPPAITGAIALVKVEYWHKDHLGSLAATTDHTGIGVTGRYAYDPFGKRRYTNGNYDAVGNLVIDWNPAINNGTDRGFTGHEQLDDIGLVHMNGRIFDPALGIFLQADPQIQEPDNGQNYHRYGYCLNNPLTCTDPTGHSWLSKSWKKIWHNKAIRTVASIAVAVYLGPAGAGALFESGLANAAAAGFASSAIATGSFEGALQGTFSAAVFYGIGSLVGTAGMDAAGNVVDPSRFAGAVALHAVAGCVTSVAGGGPCGPGALSAAFSKAATPWSIPLGRDDLVAGTLVSSAIGGTASVLGGGKFANGAQTAAFSYLFNAMSVAARARLVAAGGFLGGTLGTTFAGGCALGTGGACALGAPTIIAVGIAAGAATGDAIASVTDWLDDQVTEMMSQSLSTSGTQAQTHGNSAMSLRPTYVYMLIDSVGDVQKFGVTSNPVAELRYTKAYYRVTSTSMVILARHESRALALAHEFALCGTYVAYTGKFPSLSKKC